MERGWLILYDDRMTKRYVGGIVMDGLGRILLVRRTPSDPQMGGLWSLPAGEVEPGEADDQALTREFSEVVGLNIRVHDLAASVSRPNWAVNMYDVSTDDKIEPRPNDPDIAEVAYFAVGDLPERTVLEARIGIIRCWLRRADSINAATYSRLIDGLFSSLFYSYLAPWLDRFSDFDFLPVVKRLIFGTPFRKFKSAVPFLLSDMSQEARALAVTSEISFALWTVLDDMCDERQARYGVPTIHEQIGRRETLSCLFGSVESLRRSLNEKFDSGYADAIAEALLLCAKGQIEHFNRRTYASVDEYLAVAADRTEFLGVTWDYSMRCLGEQGKGTALRQLHSKTARFGQLLNDYFDLREPAQLRDYKSHTYSSYAIILREKIEEQGNFDLLWDRQTRQDAVAGFHEALTKYDVQGDMSLRASAMLNSLLSYVQQLPFDAAERTMISGWLELSGFWLVHASAAEPDRASDMTKFVDHLDGLCGELQ